MIDDEGYYINDSGFEYRWWYSCCQYSLSGSVCYSDSIQHPHPIGAGDTSNAAVWNPETTSRPYETDLANLGSADWDKLNAGSTEVDIAIADVNDPNQFVLAIENWQIDKGGEVRLTLNDGTYFTRAQVLIQEVMDADALTEEGAGLFSGIENAGVIGLATWGIGQSLSEEQLSLLTANQGGLGFIQARALEGSNTDLTQEFSDMITTQRAFQAGSKVISVSDEMLQEIINLKR